MPVRNKRPLLLAVIGTLANMATTEKYLKVDVPSPAGYIIGEFFQPLSGKTGVYYLKDKKS